MANLLIIRKNAEERLLTALDNLQRSFDEFRRRVVLESESGEPSAGSMQFYHNDVAKQLELVKWLVGEVDYARVDQIKRLRVPQNLCVADDEKCDREQSLGVEVLDCIDAVPVVFGEDMRFLGVNPGGHLVFVRRFGEGDEPTFVYAVPSEENHGDFAEEAVKLLSVGFSAADFKKIKNALWNIHSKWDMRTLATWVVDASLFARGCSRNLDDWMFVLDMAYLNSLGLYINNCFAWKNDFREVYADGFNEDGRVYPVCSETDDDTLPVEKKVKKQRERFLGNGFYKSVSPYFEEKGKYLGENMMKEHVFVRRFAKDELPVFELVTATELEQPKDREGVHRFMKPPFSGLELKRRMVGARELLCESTSDFNTWLCIADCDYLNSLGDYINRRLDTLDECLHTRKKRKKSRGCQFK